MNELEVIAQMAAQIYTANIIIKAPMRYRTAVSHAMRIMDECKSQQPAYGQPGVIKQGPTIEDAGQEIKNIMHHALNAAIELVLYGDKTHKPEHTDYINFDQALALLKTVYENQQKHEASITKR